MVILFIFITTYQWLLSFLMGYETPWTMLFTLPVCAGLSIYGGGLMRDLLKEFG